ncbi:MAG: CBS domain-containing protein [Pedobacter sp.]|nr:CBS domain-containing protein [Chitinophagaceae bacterium]
MTHKAEFLKNVAPFHLLPAEVIEATSDLLQEVRFNKESIIYKQNTTNLKGVDILVEGEYESFFYDSSHNKRLLEIYGRGYCFGGISMLLNEKKCLRTIVVKKGTVVYFLARKYFMNLCQAYEPFFLHFITEFSKKMLDDEFAHFYKNGVSFEKTYTTPDQLFSKKIESIEYRDIVSCNDNTPVFEAAKLMAQYKLSCLFVKNDANKLIGFITDITLRDKVVVKQLAYNTPVKYIMDNPLVSINSEAYVYDIILRMFREKTRYLLIEKNGEFIGFITRNKLLSEQGQSPLVFIQSVRQALSIEELKRKWEAVPELILQLLNNGVHTEIVNQLIATVSDTIAIKIIEKVIKEMGQPPAKFVFMVLGSEGRKEQTLKTDQDNAIIYEDKANEHRELVREYFLQFATTVSDRLNQVGFVYCTGGYMAQNPKWTHSLSHWKRNYDDWMAAIVPETVIQFSTFFDCRYLYGEASILEELKDYLNEELEKPMERLFFFMAKNALQYEPPLTGIFKNIKTFKIGEHEVFDIKKTMTPIVDLVRVFALRNHIFEVNTGERLKALKNIGVFTEEECKDLLQSYYYLMGMRLKKHAMQIIHDHTLPDNFINTKTLTRIDKITLIEIFKTIENFQSKIRITFTNTLLG